MIQERILKEATFAPNSVRYRGASTWIPLLLMVFTIPIIPIVLPITIWYWRKQYARMRVILTSRDLKVHRGVFNREEKSIPLEKITDLAVFEGPIMRYYGVRGIRVETAGQTSVGGALVTVIGIEETDAFRDMVLRQRDRIADTDGEALPAPSAGPAAVAAGSDEVLGALRQIHETLQRIERALAR